MRRFLQLLCPMDGSLGAPITASGTLHLCQQETKCECACSVLRCVQLFATPWIGARQAPLSMLFSRQEYSSGLPFPSPGDLSDPGVEPESPALQADSLLMSHWGSPELEP